jgi:hypothetical protein
MDNGLETQFSCCPIVVAGLRLTINHVDPRPRPGQDTHLAQAQNQ